MGIDVNSDARLSYSLESLPALLGKGELRVLKTAMQNALADRHEPQTRAETEGEYIARLIRTAAGVRFERPHREEAPIDPVFEKLF